MKKYLAFLLAICLVLAWVPPVSAADSVGGVCGDDARWAYDAATGTLSITGTGSTDDYRDMEDVLIDRPWMHLRTDIRHLVIGEGITRLGHQAFDGLENLETVTFSSTLTEIGNFCFCFCPKLTELSFPDGLQAIGQQAFWCCNGLTEVYLPASLTFLDACAFEECRGLRRASFASDPDVFMYIIGNSPFRGCTALEEIQVEAGHISLKSIDGVLYSADDYGLTLQQYPLGRSDSAYTIESGTYYVSQFSIEDPAGLESITVPASVEYIGNFALGGGTLKEVFFQGNAPTLASDALGLRPMTVYYPEGNATWTKEVMASQHWQLTWLPYTPANPFWDVPNGSFYEAPVVWALEGGITSGTSENSFSPDNNCLRAQVVTFLWRAAGQPEPTSSVNPFVDVKDTDFYCKAVLWAVEQGITNGADATHFNPLGVCNRAQVVTFLYRAFHSPAVENGNNPFTDVPSGTWYAVPVLWAVEQEITNGLSATAFGPNADCNRAQIVTFLYRAYN